MKEAQHPSLHCPQEPRLSKVEVIQEQILETLNTLKDLLTSSIRSEERITTLQNTVSGLEVRLLSVEKQAHTTSWLHTLALAAAAAVVTGWLSFKGVDK